MADFDSLRRFLNPCLFHLQKMELELKCPVCLNLLSQPMMLPCNHIFCRPCISGKSEFESGCLLCKSTYANQDLRSIPQMEAVVSIYKSMDATFGAKLFRPKRSRVESGDACDRKERVHGLHKENSYNTRNWVRYITPSKRIRASPDHRKIEVVTPLRPFKSFKSRNEGESAESVELSTQNCKCDSISIRGAFVNDGEPALPSFSSYSDSKCEEQVTDRRDFTQRENELNGSPPSFLEIKDSYDDSNDQASERVEEQLSSKGKFETGSQDGNDIEGCSTIPNSKIAAAAASAKVDVRSSIPPSEVDQGRESKGQVSDHKPYDMSSNPHNSTTYVICAFCQSSEVTQASGPMLHYLNGKAVEVDKATQCNVLHVHKSCSEWAPQVYFVGETLVNLEAELARGGKIKCSSCGKKGAALGCYAKSCRRSFHVPCAVEVPKCRWDFDNFLMLCPAHAYLKLPNERSKSRKKRLNMFSTTQLEYWQTSGDCPSGLENSAAIWTDSSKESSEWVICGSALSSEDKELLLEFSALTGIRLSKTWSANVTHVIASTNETGACSRTLKFLMAILSGRWILKIDWIKACIEAKDPVYEEPYEISCDIHGSCGGPKNGRTRVMEKVPKLLNGLRFYFCGDFMPSYNGYLQDLVVAAGGTVLMRKDMASCNSTMEAAKTTFVLYNQDPPKAGGSTESLSALERQRCDAEAIAGETNSQVVGHAWLLDSIAACSLLPICP